MRHSTGKPTKAQQKRFDRIKRDICIVCHHFCGSLSLAPEIHHLLSGNRRRGHDFTIGLCPWHHRGVPTINKTVSQFRLGPSLALTSKAFRATFGTDDELLALQNKRLESMP